MRGVFLFFGELVVTAGSVGAGLCSFRAGVGAGLCSFRASAGLVFGPVSVQCQPVLGSVGAVFILNGMIFSFLDEKRVFKGVV